METRVLFAYMLIGVLIAGAVLMSTFLSRKRRERRRRRTAWRRSRTRQHEQSTAQ